MSSNLLSIDQGTTSSRVIIFNREGLPLGQHQIETKTHYPHSGWVEQDPNEIYQNVLTCCEKALKACQLTLSDITAIGITNQRETTILWDVETGEAIHNAIIWQDRRTEELCQIHKDAGMESVVQQKTGLLLDPYFSASKIAWLLDHVTGAREKAENGKLRFGTVDCYLLWRLTGGQSHFTDASNASRTLLFNIHRQTWDEELLRLFHIPKDILPEVKDTSAEFGALDKKQFDEAVPITALAGDQQAALVGQTCFQSGNMKSTFGTGCFLVCHTGEKALLSKNRLLTTVAYRLAGKVSYALEGSIFSAGSAIQWLRDELHLLDNVGVSEEIAGDLPDNGGVYFIPAFTGLGAPYWDAKARGAILGLSRDTQSHHVVRAALEAVAYQTKDLIEAMKKDGVMPESSMKVDGGMVANQWLMQFLADVLDCPIALSRVNETTALGIAYLAGLGSSVYESLDEIKTLWQHQSNFQPQMDDVTRDRLYGNWLEMIAKVLQ